MVLLTYLTYKVAEGLGDQFMAYLRRQHLTELRSRLKEARLLYEDGKITEEDYKKLEADLMARIKSVQAQLQYAPRIVEVRL